MRPGAPAGVQFLSALLEASPDCVKALSLDGRVLYINARGLELNQLDSFDRIRGRRLADLWPVDERPKVADAVHAAASGTTVQFEGYCPTFKGEPRWWEVRLSPMRGADGAPQYIAGISRDVSERRRVDLAARANEEKFSLLLESSGDGIYGLALDGTCTFINQAGASMLGYEAQSLVGLSLHEVIHHHRPENACHPFQKSSIYQAARQGMARRIDDEVFWHKDGHAVPVTYSVFPMMVDGEHAGTVVTYSDTTERRRVEHDLRDFAAQLSEADRRKTEFLATLAHELRNPLAPLRNGLALLAKAGDDPAAIAKVRDMMERQLAQMVHLVNDLLDIARITSGKLRLKTELVDLRRIVAMAVEASGPALSGNLHDLRIAMPQGVVLVEADATRLTQVFTNLLNNAGKYTPPGGRIELTGQVVAGGVLADRMVEIRIGDNGIGISPDSLGAIFEMFTQVGRDVNSVRGGLGIGLNLVRRLVELHGGTVGVQSAGIGHGSTFTVSLPLARERAAAAAETEEPDAPAAVRILIVDDNADAADTLGMLLSMSNHETRVAHSGAEALKIAAEFLPDIAFLDIGMPVMNGYELARCLRSQPGMERVTLVALTGWGGDEDRRRTAEAGFDEHFTKPADLVAVERLLRLQRKSRS